jgi:hypothetical protein
MVDVVDDFALKPGLRTFSNFLQTEIARECADPELLDRLTRTNGANITTYNRLRGWARERFPGDYSSDWRTDTSNKPCGKERVQMLWAAWLAWKEGGGL